MSKQDVIVMHSGGRDSFLAACRLLEEPQDYHLKMVTFDNGFSYCSGNAKGVYDRIAKKYGSERVEFLGVYKTSSVIREFFAPYFNMTPTEQAKEFFGLTPSQYHCLICRTAMYIYSIWLGLLNGSLYIAEGGRKSQEFVIELPGMAQKRYPALVQSVGMELLLPVYDLSDNWERDNELLSRGYLCKSLEGKCLIGFPVNNSIDENVIKGVHAYYDKVILPRIEERELLTINCAQRYIGNGYDELHA